MGSNRHCCHSRMFLSGIQSALFFILFCSGCSMVTPRHGGVYEEGYRAGVQEQMKQIAANFQGGNFPYYHWTRPMVQEVMVPAHIANGVFIPEHKEMVIIQPGEWAMGPSYPINAQPKENYANAKDMPIAVSDITALPSGVSHSTTADRGTKN